MGRRSAGLAPFDPRALAEYERCFNDPATIHATCGANRIAPTAIVTHGAPWAGLETERCGWWVAPQTDALFAGLSVATALPAVERRNMGLRGRAWMERNFGWGAIGQQMTEVYSWLCHGRRVPAYVVMD